MRPPRPAIEQLAEIDRKRAVDRRHVDPASVGELRLQPLDPVLRQQRDKAGIDVRAAGDIALLPLMLDPGLVRIRADEAVFRSHGIVDEAQRRDAAHEGRVELRLGQAEAACDGAHQRAAKRFHPHIIVRDGGAPPGQGVLRRKRRRLAKRVGRIHGGIRMGDVGAHVDALLVRRSAVLQREEPAIDVGPRGVERAPQQLRLLRVRKREQAQKLPPHFPAHRHVPLEAGDRHEADLGGCPHDRGVRGIAGGAGRPEEGETSMDGIMAGAPVASGGLDCAALPGRCRAPRSPPHVGHATCTLRQRDRT